MYSNIAHNSHVVSPDNVSAVHVYKVVIVIGILCEVLQVHVDVYGYLFEVQGSR